MNFVYSTATNDITYVDYLPAAENGAKRNIKKSVLIKGGAGLPKHRTLITPYGVKTEVSDEDLAFLESNQAFQRHAKRGFMKVMKRNVDPDKVAADMAQRDGSAPYVPNDYEAKKQGKTGGSEVVTPPTTAPRSKNPFDN